MQPLAFGAALAAGLALAGEVMAAPRVMSVDSCADQFVIALSPRDAIVGVTCHDSRHLAMDAGEAGADYVAFGAFFPTGTKATEHRAEIDILQWWAEIFEVPCVAIGGITPANCGPLVAAGVDFLAVVSAVWDHPDGPAAAVRDFADAIAAAREGLVPVAGTT
jgi:thiamine-phosphate diphosphorylase